MLEALYYGALDADAWFRFQLVRVYGRHAGEARYRQRHDDPAVESAWLALESANERWIAAYRASLR